MIGHYLLTLITDQEDRVLIQAMQAGSYWGPCLVGAALGADTGSTSGFALYCNRRWPIPMDGWVAIHDEERRLSVENRFDALCARFGAPRVNAAIRTRILSNRARRILVGVTDAAVA